MATNNTKTSTSTNEKVPIGLSKTAAGWLDRLNKKLSPDRFWRIIAEWPELDGMLIYIYRRYPEIDRKLYNPKANLYIGLQKGKDAKIDEEWLLRVWGSGEYRLKFNDDNRPSGRKEVCTAVVTLNDPERPPVIENMEELIIEAPNNRSFVNGLRARGELPASSSSTGEPMASTSDPATSELAGVASEVIRQGLNTSQAPAGAMAAIADIYRTASAEAVKLTAAQGRPVDPIEQAARLKQLLGSGENTSLMNTLLQQMQRGHEMLISVMERRAEPAVTPSLAGELETMEHLLTMVNRLGGRRGGGDGGSWLDVLPPLADAGARMFQSVAQIRTGAAAAPATGAPAAPATGGPAAPATGGPAAPVPTAAGPVVISQPEPAPAAGSPSLAAPGAAAEMAGRVAAAIGKGVPGDQFAQSVDLIYGTAVYDQICSLGREPVLDLLRASVPESEALKVQEFVNRFFDYGESTPEESEVPNESGV